MDFTLARSRPIVTHRYHSKPFKMELTGSSSHIDQPSGIATDLHDTIFVTGKEKGIVAEIKGNKSVDLLQEGTPGFLKVNMPYVEPNSMSSSLLAMMLSLFAHFDQPQHRHFR